MLKAPKRTPYLRKLPAGALIERLDLGGDRVAAEHAERLRQPIGEAAGEAGQIGGIVQRDERREPSAELRGKPSLDAPRDAFALGRPKMLVGEQLQSWA